MTNAANVTFGQNQRFSRWLGNMSLRMFPGGFAPRIFVADNRQSSGYRTDPMQPLRALTDRRRHLALALIVIALCVKALMPAGYMASSSAENGLMITICSDATNGLKQMWLPIPGKPAKPDHSEAAIKADHCAFAGLGHVALGGADGFLLALAVAFILVLGFAPTPHLALGELAHLRPPLRGPPASA